jgi:hypothetical protein
MKVLAELFFHSSYARPTQARLVEPLREIAVAWIKTSRERFSEREAFGLGIQAGPTGLRDHAGRTFIC